MIGSLLYASISTRPDISYITGKLAQYMRNPGKVHYEATKHAIKYLKGTTTLGLKYSRFDPNGNAKPITITAYCDSDYATDTDTRISTSGLLVFVAGSLVSWQSRKQNRVTLSTCESEYYALADATTEVMHLRSFLDELGYTQEESTPIYCDNAATVMVSNGNKISTKLKHVAVRYHFLRNEVTSGTINPTWISTQEQLADMMTKSLDYPLLSRFRNQILATTGVVTAPGTSD